MGHHLQGQRRLALGHLLLDRDTGLAAARRVFSPRLRKIQPHVAERGQVAAAQGRAHAHLAVVHLAQAPTPLTGHTDRMLALLGEARLIDQQYTRGRATECAIGFLRHLVEHRLVIPVRVAEHVLETLLIGADHHLFHPLHVLVLGLHQAFEVIARRSEYRTGTALKVRGEAVVKPQEAGCQIINLIDASIR